MNDFMEIHWGYHIWEKAAGEVVNIVGKEFLDQIDEIIHFSGFKTLVVAACFSTDRDVLSQWRAYADDGNGYVIGFKAKDLLQLPVRGLKVLYHEKKQITELKKTILGLHELEEKSEDKFGADFRVFCYGLAADLAAFKNPAFAEEKEVRLVHALGFEPSNNFLKLVGSPGFAFGKETEGSTVRFRMKQNIPTAFIDQDYSNDGLCNAIEEVIIGPKNPVLESAISVYLETLNHPLVKVINSKASYR